MPYWAPLGQRVLGATRRGKATGECFHGTDGIPPSIHRACAFRPLQAKGAAYHVQAGVDGPIPLRREPDPPAVAATNEVRGPERGRTLVRQGHEERRVRRVLHQHFRDRPRRLSEARKIRRCVREGQLEVLRRRDVGTGATAVRAHVAGGELVPVGRGGGRGHRREVHIRRRSPFSTRYCCRRRR